jgi:hypothetical protein
MNRNIWVYLNEQGRGFVYNRIAFVVPHEFREAYDNHELRVISSNEFPLIEDRRQEIDLHILVPTYATVRENKLILYSESTLHFEI